MRAKVWQDSKDFITSRVVCSFGTEFYMIVVNGVFHVKKTTSRWNLQGVIRIHDNNLGVEPKIGGKTPQIIHFKRVFPYKPSILGGFPPIFGNIHFKF